MTITCIAYLATATVKQKSAQWTMVDGSSQIDKKKTLKNLLLCNKLF